jgi:terminase small subunit / prophage DNA-packing protein
MRITGQEQIASMFAVTVKTINEWQAQGMPVALRGEFAGGVPNEYESGACIGWLIEREVGKVRGETQRDRLARVQADAIEMDNQTKRRELVPVAQIEPTMRAAMIAAREAWRNEPPRLVRMAKLKGDVAARFEQSLQESFDAFLVRVSRWRDAKPADDNADDDDDNQQPTTAVEAAEERNPDDKPRNRRRPAR